MPHVSARVDIRYDRSLEGGMTDEIIRRYGKRVRCADCEVRPAWNDLSDGTPSGATAFAGWACRAVVQKEKKHGVSRAFERRHEPAGKSAFAPRRNGIPDIRSYGGTAFAGWHAQP